MLAVGPPQGTLRRGKLAALGPLAHAQGAGGGLDRVALALGRGHRLERYRLVPLCRLLGGRDDVTPSGALPRRRQPDPRALPDGARPGRRVPTDDLSGRAREWEAALPRDSGEDRAHAGRHTAHRHRPDTGGWKTTTGSCSRPTAAARRCALPPPRRGDRGPQTEPRVRVGVGGGSRARGDQRSRARKSVRTSASRPAPEALGDSPRPPEERPHPARQPPLSAHPAPEPEERRDDQAVPGEAHHPVERK